MKDAESHSLAALTSLWVSSCPLFCHCNETFDQFSLVDKKIFSAASRSIGSCRPADINMYLPDELGITHNLKNSCNISLTIAGFSANGACPASSTISSEVLLIVSSNNFECSIGIKLSLLPHMTRVGTS